MIGNNKITYTKPLRYEIGVEHINKIYKEKQATVFSPVFSGLDNSFYFLDLDNHEPIHVSLNLFAVFSPAILN